MTDYTLTCQYDDDPAEVSQMRCASDQDAMDCARAHLQLVIDKSPTLDRAQAAVAKSAPGDATPRPIGCWRWTADNEDWVWSAQA